MTQNVPMHKLHIMRKTQKAPCEEKVLSSIVMTSAITNQLPNKNCIVGMNIDFSSEKIAESIFLMVLVLSVTISFVIKLRIIFF